MKIHDVFRTLPRKRTIYSVAIFRIFRDIVIFGTAERLGGRGSGISAKKIQKCCEKLYADPLFKIQVFGHNFTKSARIELRFWEVANLEKLNNFYHGHL